MKLIVNLKLKPLESQHADLLRTLERAGEACNWISEQAFENKVFKQFAIHKIVYLSAKDKFSLSSQMVIRAISKVADSYQIQKAKQTFFKKHGSIAYDSRILTFKSSNKVSLWTLNGRQTIPFVCGEYQRKLLPFLKGEVDLIYRKGQFFLNAVCDVPEEHPMIPDNVIGVDFGIVQLATDSTGESFTGAFVERVRQKFSNQRQLLQHKASKQTQSGKRPRHIHKLIKRLSGREKNFRKHQNHVISKKLVEKAKALNSGIALENLEGIRKRIEKRLRVSQRAKISGWSFFQLREFVTYKSKLNGVPIILVNPKYTSQECSECGHTEKANRKSQSEFECKNCHVSINADINASRNIRSRAFVNTLQSSENIVLKNAV
ncbi:MAG: IS200/IS605 family element transposase accessory protein TnpB [Acidobacteria bacterium]|nr:IS200/IS605 family element transposase accessory protein TnpB [Acidobacteriota bacterium]